ncbi:DUF397 domain-containing protein [Actinoplanes sp. NPDC051859]|uniref:DUF397 domain-containing protein n=1 Tax=Actinoplanes sp. NPDC051859 TaxID=3363909 RepID=UPI00378B5AE1
MDLSEARWLKSTRSSGGGSGDCVEVARNLSGVVAVRDSKNPAGPVLVFGPSEWAALVSDVKAGMLDR